MKNCMLELIDSSLIIDENRQSEPEITNDIKPEITQEIEPKTENETKIENDSEITAELETVDFDESMDKSVSSENNETVVDETITTNKQEEENFVENNTDISKEDVKNNVSKVLHEQENLNQNTDYQVPTIEVNHEKVKQIIEAKRNGLKKSNKNEVHNLISGKINEAEIVENEQITKVDVIENDALLLESVFESEESVLNENIKKAIINRPKISTQKNNENIYFENDSLKTQLSTLSNQTLPTSSENINPDNIEETNQNNIEETKTEVDDNNQNIDIDLIIEKLKENKINIDKKKVEEIIVEYKKNESSDEISEERLINYIKYFHGYDKQLALNKLYKLKNTLEQITEKEISTMDVLNMQLKLLNKDTEEKMIRVIDKDSSVDLYQLGDDVSMSKDKIYLWGDTLYLEE